MRRHTTINLDPELVSAAAEMLGTRGTTDTVHAALREAVARRHRRFLAQMPLPDLTPQAVEEMRSARTGSRRRARGVAPAR